MTRLALLLLICIPASLMAPTASAERPEPVLCWQAMGLPEPALMARLILAESGGDPMAVSNRGAVGVCQIMPALARSLGHDPARLHEPDYNLVVGGRWLQRLIDKYGSVDAALRAWNAGETRRYLWHSESVNNFVRKVRG